VYAKPTAPRSIGGLIDDAFRLWREALAKTWVTALIAQLAVSVPLLMFRVPVVPGAAQNPQQLLAMYRSPMFWLCYLIAVLLGSGLYNAILVQTASAAEQRSMTVGESLGVGFRLLPRTILLGLAFAAGVSILAVLFLLPALAWGVLARVVLGSACFLILFFLLGRLFLAQPVLIVEDAGVIDSLKSSWNLTQGHWWRCATILTVVIIIFFVFLLVVGFVAGLATAFVGPGSTAAAIMGQLLSVVGNTVFTPLLIAVILSIYYDLRLRKEGGDLADRVSALASQ
jgi:hypothetical protein